MEYGAKVIDADIVARRIVSKGQKALDEIVDVFGKDILLENGELHRKKLGSIVFKEKEKLDILNNITHKYIFEEIREKIAIEREKMKYNIIVIDAAILIESRLYTLCDFVWVVVADNEIKLKRVMERDKLSEDDARERINAQLPEQEMLPYASSVIYNNGDLESMREKVEAEVKMCL